MFGDQRVRWAAIGAAIAVTLGAGGLGVVSATISSGSKAVFVPIVPCRLVDTRPATPLGPKSTTTYNVHGTNGACTIPAGATAISGNATITDPTDDGFMTIAPKGGIGTASNLNWLRGQSPTPNAFTVALSADGKIDVYNDRATVNVIIDINGYYEDHNHDDRYYTKAQSDAALAAKASVTQTMVFSGRDLTEGGDFQTGTSNGCTVDLNGQQGRLSLNLPVGATIVSVKGSFFDSSGTGSFTASLTKVTTGVFGDNAGTIKSVTGGDLNIATVTLDMTPPTTQTVDVNNKYEVRFNDGFGSFGNGALCHVIVTYTTSASAVGPFEASSDEPVGAPPSCAVDDAACKVEVP